MADNSEKTRLLTILRAERARWEALLEEIGEARLTQPGVAGDWSVKDVLGHLAAYHRYWGAQLRGATTGVPPTMRDLFDVDALPEGAGCWTEEEQNAAIHAQHAPLPLPVVLAKWREASDLLTDAVAALTEEDVTTPGRFPWAGDRPLGEAMAGDTYAHAAVHAADVRAWLDRSGA
jgi:uncharacterized damage-inducible protein DinB